MEAKRVWTEEEIKRLLQTNDKMICKSLNELYKCQTNDEKSSKTTKIHNGAGFNAIDAQFMTNVAEFYNSKGFLTDKQIAIVRKKIMKYTKQLTRIANA